MFLFVGNEYINLDAIARVSFATEPAGYIATIHFSKTGGADRHHCRGEDAKKLEEVLKELQFVSTIKKKAKK